MSVPAKHRESFHIYILLRLFRFYGCKQSLGCYKTALATLTPTQDLNKVLKNLQGKNGGLTLGDKKLEAIYHPSFTLDFGKPRLGK